MSPVVVALLLFAGLSEAAGRILPLVARRPGMSRTFVAGLLLPGGLVEGAVFALWPLTAWTLAELCQEVEKRWGVSYHPSHMGKLMHRLGLSRQKARPSHPKADAAAREAFAKGGCRPLWTTRG